MRSGLGVRDRLEELARCCRAIGIRGPPGFRGLDEVLERHALERLSRYCARPPFAADRLAPVDENTVAYELRKPTQDLADLPVP